MLSSFNARPNFASGYLSEETTQRKGTGGFWTVEYYQSYFDVDTKTVRFQLLLDRLIVTQGLTPRSYRDVTQHSTQLHPSPTSPRILTLQTFTGHSGLSQRSFSPSSCLPLWEPLLPPTFQRMTRSMTIISSFSALLYLWYTFMA